MKRIIKVNLADIAGNILAKKLDYFIDLEKMIENCRKSIGLSSPEEDSLLLSQNMRIRIKYITEKLIDYQVYTLFRTLHGILIETLKNIPGLEDLVEKINKSDVPAFLFCFFEPKISQDILGIFSRENIMTTMISRYNCWNSIRYSKVFDKEDKIMSILLLQKSQDNFLKLCTNIILDNLQIIVAVENNFEDFDLVYFSEVEKDHSEFMQVITTVYDKLHDNCIEASSWYVAWNLLIKMINEKYGLSYDNINLTSLEHNINSEVNKIYHFH